jgi:ABC-type molybdenum transport system ATPase subunit/photorepair protein PhrA
VAQIKITIPGFGEHDSDRPIVILGPNGSGKTKLAQQITGTNHVSPISAQRRTWIDDSLPVQEENQLRSNIQNNIHQWRSNSWQPTQEINYILSTLIQDHTNTLTKRNENAIVSGDLMEPVRNTKLILLQTLWNRLFPNRKLEIGGFFPKVKRLDASSDSPAYQLREMSDGERTVLYMAARVLTADNTIILVDEPELHMHSRLSVQFWDEAEKLRPDCRFIYITHDLNFTLSRHNATVLVIQPNSGTNEILLEQLPASVAPEILGAATLPFYAKRIFLFEGAPATGFANEFFISWFDDDETFTIPAGNRDSVSAAVLGLQAVGLVAAEVIGLIDRDYYSDDILARIPNNITVLPLHEIESVLCDQKVVAALAEHFGKNPSVVWKEFVDKVCHEFRGQTLNNVVANRVRSRIGDLLDGVFRSSQIVADTNQTSDNHSATLLALDLPTKVTGMFSEELNRVERAIADGSKDMLAILPGKHLLSFLAGILGFRNTSELTALVVRSLNRRHLSTDDPLLVLGDKIETGLLEYLPPRRI